MQCGVCRYGIAFLYAGKLVREEGSGYSAGRVMNVIFAAVVAGFSLGQMAPNFSAFASGALTYRSGLAVRILFPGQCLLAHQCFKYGATWCSMMQYIANSTDRYGAYVCSGRSAGFRLRQVTERQPAIDVEATGMVPSEPMQACFYSLLQKLL